MKITNLPVTDSCMLTFFAPFQHRKYSISREGKILFDSKYIETEFRKSYTEHFLVSEINEDTAKKIFDVAELSSPYINYENRNETFDSALESLQSFMRAYGIEYKERIHIICPKPSKKLKGKKIIMEFSLINPQFKSSGNYDLEVFMSNITKTSKSVTFSVNIPKYIYDKCMEDVDPERRPKLKYIEANTISTLHTLMGEYSDQASHVAHMQTDSENYDKIICINFNSNETLTRDDFNHSYTGQKINTSFNYFIAYRIKNNGISSNFRFFTFKKYQSGVGTTEKGIEGIIDTESIGKKYFLMNNPKIYLDWTQEREDFLEALESKFRNLSDTLNKFLKDIDADKLEHLIANANNLKLLN